MKLLLVLLAVCFVAVVGTAVAVYLRVRNHRLEKRRLDRITGSVRRVVEEIGVPAARQRHN